MMFGTMQLCSVVECQTHEPRQFAFLDGNHAIITNRINHAVAWPHFLNGTRTVWRVYWGSSDETLIEDDASIGGDVDVVEPFVVRDLDVRATRQVTNFYSDSSPLGLGLLTDAQRRED